MIKMRSRKATKELVKENMVVCAGLYRKDEGRRTLIKRKAISMTILRVLVYGLRKMV